MSQGEGHDGTGLSALGNIYETVALSFQYLFLLFRHNRIVHTLRLLNIKRKRCESVPNCCDGTYIIQKLFVTM